MDIHIGGIIPFTKLTNEHGFWIAVSLFLATAFLVGLASRNRSASHRARAAVDAAWVISGVSAFLIASWSVSADGPRRLADRALYNAIGDAIQLQIEGHSYSSKYCGSGMQLHCPDMIRLVADSVRLSEALPGNVVTSIVPRFGNYEDDCADMTQVDVAEWGRVCLTIHYANQGIDQLNANLVGATLANLSDFTRALWVWIFPIVGGFRVQRSLREWSQAPDPIGLAPGFR
jgi:hypothetical protein